MDTNNGRSDLAAMLESMDLEGLKDLRKKVDRAISSYETRKRQEALSAVKGCERPVEITAAPTWAADHTEAAQFPVTIAFSGDSASCRPRSQQRSYVYLQEQNLARFSLEGHRHVASAPALGHWTGTVLDHIPGT